MKSSQQSSKHPFLIVMGSFVLAMLAANVWGQIRGPQLGYAFDKAEGVLRPILGVPGASRLGEPVNLGVSLVLAKFSPKQDYVIGVTQEAGNLVLITAGETDQLSSTFTIEALGPGAGHVSVSSEGKSAVILFPHNQTLKILSGLPKAPVLAAEVDLSLVGLPDVMTVDDDGKLVILAVSDSSGSRISAYSPETGLQLLGIFGKVAALSLSADRQVLVADRENHEAILIRDVLGAAQRIRVGAREDGIADPVAAEFSADQTHVYVANAGSRSIASLSLDGASKSLTFCDCTPAALERLDGDEVFRLTDLSEKPLLLFEAGAAENRVVFVPIGEARGNRALRERRANPLIITRRSRLP